MSDLVNAASCSGAKAPKPDIGLVVGILVLASSVSIMSTDMYTPSLPDLAVWFDTTPTHVKLTISLNMLAFGLAQLVHGPLSDRYGRKPVLLYSLIAVVALCMACAAAQTINQLIAARIFLGLAAAAEAVIGLAIIKDLYTEKEQIKALALLGMVIAIAPAIAPILGGYIHASWGWQANFFVIAAMALIAFLVVLKFLPESTRPNPDALRVSSILTGYGNLIKNLDFVVHTVMLGVAMGLIFVFITGAPFVLIGLMGVDVEQFGYYQAGIVTTFFFGSVFASRFADRWEAMSLLGLGVSLILLGVAILAIVILFKQSNPVTLTASFAIMTFGMGPLFAVAPSRALRSIKGQAGTASAMLSGFEQTMAGMAAVVISLINDGSARPMLIVSFFLACLLVVLYQRSKYEDVLIAARHPAV